MTKQTLFKELTLKAVMAGLVFGIIGAIMNVYLNLKVGLGQDIALMVVPVTWALWRALRVEHTMQENNVAQAIANASCASLGAWFGSILPALLMYGYTIPLWELFVMASCTGIIGVILADTFRFQMINIEKLPFPYAAPVGTMLFTLYEKTRDTIRRSLYLFLSIVSAAIFSGFRDLTKWIGDTISVRLPFNSQLSLYLSPLMFGVGYLMGPAVGLTLLAGSMLSWQILAPLLAQLSIIPSMSYGDVVSFIRWPAIGMMLTSSFIALAKDKGARNAVLSFFKDKNNMLVKRPTANTRNLLFITCNTLLLLIFLKETMATSQHIDLIVVLTLVALSALALSFLTSLILMRSVGETGLVPLGTMGALALLIFGSFRIGTAIPLIYILLSAYASQAGAMATDMLGGFKVTEMIHGTSSSVQKAKIFGIIVGAATATIFASAILNLYGTMNPEIPAPGAVTIKGLSDAIISGYNFPIFTWLALVIGVVFAVVAAIVGLKISITALGLGLILPGNFVMIIGLGALAKWILNRRAPQMQETMKTVITGLIAGEAVTGALMAMLVTLGLC